LDLGSSTRLADCTSLSSHLFSCKICKMASFMTAFAAFCACAATVIIVANAHDAPMCTDIFPRLDRCQQVHLVSRGSWCKPRHESFLPVPDTNLCCDTKDASVQNLTFWTPPNGPSDVCGIAPSLPPNTDHVLDTLGGLQHQRWAQGRKAFEIVRSPTDCACSNDQAKDNKTWVWQSSYGACWIEWDARKFCTLLGRRRILFLGGTAAERAFVATHNAVAWGYRDEYGKVGCQSQLAYGAMDNLREWSGWVKLMQPTVVVLDGGDTLNVSEIMTVLRRVHDELSVLGVQLAWLMWPPPCDPIKAAASYATRRQLTEITTAFWKSRGGNTAAVLDISSTQVGTGSNDDKSGQMLSTTLPQLLQQAMRHGNPLSDSTSSPQTWATILQATFAAEVRAVHTTCHQRVGGYVTFDPSFGFNNQIISVANAAWYGLHTNHMLVFPRALDWMHTRFDLRPLFSAFCFVDDAGIPPGAKTIKFSRNMFYTHIRSSDQNRWFNFRSALFELLFHRPTELLQTAVSRVKREALGGLPYVGVHVRNINGDKVKWVGRMKQLYGVDFERGPTVARLDSPHGNTTYEMSPGYIVSQLAVHGLSNTTLFLAHDRESNDRVKRLHDAAHIKAIKASPKVYPELKGHADAILVDMLVLMDSELFLGNEASTLSWNVVSVRRARGQLQDNILGPDH
jgi:hypothetical protein